MRGIDMVLVESGNASVCNTQLMNGAQSCATVALFISTIQGIPSCESITFAIQ